MRTFDLTPLLRSTVGFDRFDRLFEAATRGEDSPHYPPYNIESYEDDRYRVQIAVAGFTESDLDITVQDRTLVVTGKSSQETNDGTETKYLHRGIARRSFERRFDLADTIRVTSAKLENGLLSIDMVREVPEALKPRKIDIARTDNRVDIGKAA